MFQKVGPRGLRVGLCVLAGAVALTAISSDQADARGRRGKRHVAAYSPPYAAIVVDANSGSTMHAANADALRHPASLTKIMTLYMLFEQLEAGKLRLDSQLEVSQHASMQAPTKLGLRPGQTLSVEDAIRGLVTKSANDAAAVVAEAIGGDEETFGKMMTRKARALGMSRTVYVNASGLPDEDQITTARDQATLGRAIQDRFPRYYRYFATPSFTYRGRAMRNHNRLLGNVEGVDGIKTGYTRMSGFNLVSSVRRGNHHIVAVVLGGASGGSRDARMRSLIEQHIDDGASQRTVAKITEGNAGTEVAAVLPKTERPVATPDFKAQPLPQVQTQAAMQAPAAASAPRMSRGDDMAPATTASVAPVETANIAIAQSHAAVAEATTLSRQPKAGSAEPLNPVKVKTITVKAGNVQTAMLVPLSPAPSASVAPAHFAAKQQQPAAEAAPLTPPPGARPGILGTLPANPAPIAAPAKYEVASATSTPVSLPATRQAVVRSGWKIQLGAFPKETEAQERLREAQNLAKTVLRKAEPFTERVTKGNQELYRARFAGFDQGSAEAACKYFKRNDIACMATKN